MSDETSSLGMFSSLAFTPYSVTSAPCDSLRMGEGPGTHLIHEDTVYIYLGAVCSYQIEDHYLEQVSLTSFVR